MRLTCSPVLTVLRHNRKFIHLLLFERSLPLPQEMGFNYISCSLGSQQAWVHVYLSESASATPLKAKHRLANPAAACRQQFSSQPCPRLAGWPCKPHSAFPAPGLQNGIADDCILYSVICFNASKLILMPFRLKASREHCTLWYSPCIADR